MVDKERVSEIDRNREGLPIRQTKRPVGILIGTSIKRDRQIAKETGKRQTMLDPSTYKLDKQEPIVRMIDIKG